MSFPHPHLASPRPQPARERAALELVSRFRQGKGLRLHVFLVCHVCSQAWLVFSVRSSSMEDEHAAATRELMARRSQRMKELYQAEYAQLNRELEDMGLTISKVL